MDMQPTRRQFLYTSSALLTLEAAFAQTSSNAVVITSLWIRHPWHRC
jgi:hypothetical protein